ncbi:MAG: biopolymer transporter ExbD [Pirellulales bacterium]
MAASMGAGYSDDDDGALSGINVTPLVDVTLVLLIVFMITVPAIVGTARVKVDLPETSAVQADSENLPLMFALKRTADGKTALFLNENPIDEAGIREMFAKVKPAPDQPVSLSADKGIEYGQVMQVVDLLESVGLKKLALDTRHVEAR